VKKSDPQEGTPSDGLNANQQTATAFWSQHTATAEAALGTITVPSPGAEIGTTPGVPTPSGIGTPDFEECEHYVDPGATLSQIARLYNNLDINYIASFNNLDNVDYIKAGTILIIPGCGQPISTPIPTVDPLTESAAVPQPDPDNSQGPVQYTVQVGDNIYRLSVRFGVSMAELLNANPIIRDTDINLISVGQSITIPRRSEVTTTTDTTIPTLTVTPNQGGTVG
jgi:LysM repeat protein